MLHNTIVIGHSIANFTRLDLGSTVNAADLDPHKAANSMCSGHDTLVVVIADCSRKSGVVGSVGYSLDTVIGVAPSHSC